MDCDCDCVSVWSCGRGDGGSWAGETPAAEEELKASSAWTRPVSRLARWCCWRSLGLSQAEDSSVSQGLSMAVDGCREEDEDPEKSS